MVLEHTAKMEDKPLKLRDVEMPKAADDQILIKIKACGQCHTDLDEIEDRLKPPRLPIILGHQIVGQVAQCGKNVKKFSPGDRVGVAWIYLSCGVCDFCKNGRENLCEKAKWTGLDANGGYAEYMAISADFAYPIPEKFSDAQAAPLLCAGVIGYRSLRLTGLTDGQSLCLIGFGDSAHLVIQIVQYKFPNSKVFVVTRGEHHRKLAIKLGAGLGRS